MLRSSMSVVTTVPVHVTSKKWNTVLYTYHIWHKEQTMYSKYYLFESHSSPIRRDNVYSGQHDRQFALTDIKFRGKHTLVWSSSVKTSMTSHSLLAIVSLLHKQIWYYNSSRRGTNRWYSWLSDVSQPHTGHSYPKRVCRVISLYLSLQPS